MVSLRTQTQTIRNSKNTNTIMATEMTLENAIASIVASKPTASSVDTSYSVGLFNANGRLVDKQPLTEIRNKFSVLNEVLIIK